ncbi:phosphoribosylanthranilate isomerase [Roseinatronobacter sp.]|uniref:phosphoribosylanthranilate isomerase n=1 Tax=Roseinatronobacter sp. TaxID=1945755 RepID=UPI0025F426E0|nr:phosphoribosylanthranilate isomerase [Rhodobaca sp.]
MPDAVKVKVCGLTTAQAVSDAVKSGADYVGFVFFPPSPRNLTLDQASVLAADVPAGITKVALTVDADNAALDALTAQVAIDMLQLHGHESPARVAEIRARYGLPVMKAVGLADRADLDILDTYLSAADQILVDAKPPKDAVLPGGNGLSFDWRLLQGRRWPCPWMLAGGLTPLNVTEAIRLTGAGQVDVSSGVERARGEKDPALMSAFIQAAKTV